MKFEHRVWLPPIDLCCDKASFDFWVFTNFEVHLKINCKNHGRHFIKSPFRLSKKNICFYPTKKLFIIIWKNLFDKQKKTFNSEVKEKYRKIINKLNKPIQIQFT